MCFELTRGQSVPVPKSICWRVHLHMYNNITPVVFSCSLEKRCGSWTLPQTPTITGCAQ